MKTKTKNRLLGILLCLALLIGMLPVFGMPAYANDAPGINILPKGSGSISSFVSDDGETFQAEAKDGYRFFYWSWKVDGVETVYEDSTLVKSEAELEDMTDITAVFVSAADPVTVQVDVGQGHMGIFTPYVLGSMASKLEASMVQAEGTTLTIIGADSGLTEYNLQQKIYYFLLNDLDVTTDNNERFMLVARKSMDEYEDGDDLDDDLDDQQENPKPLSDGFKCHLLWEKPYTKLEMSSGNPTCGKSATDTFPELPEGMGLDLKDSGWEDASGKPVERFTGGEDYTYTAMICLYWDEVLWNRYFPKNGIEISIPGAKNIEYDSYGDAVEVRYTVTAEHDWDEGKVTKEPTVDSEGERLYTCKSCSATKVESIPRIDPASTIGATYDVGGSLYVVTSAGTVSLVKAPVRKTFTLPASVQIGSRSFSVTGIEARAFKGTKTRILTVKTRRLTKKSIRRSLKGSRIWKVKVKVGKKKDNRKYVRKYKRIFTRKNAGKRVYVRR